MDIQPVNPGRILVADDEHHIRTVVAAKLREAGLTVIEARDGEEALRAAQEERPDLVVTDLQMPCMSGLELCLSLKADPRTSAVPALLLTARGYILDPEQMARTNIRRVVGKPFSARSLLATVRELLADPSGAAGTPGAAPMRDAA